jgi:hypothetical protein
MKQRVAALPAELEQDALFCIASTEFWEESFRKGGRSPSDLGGL